MKFLGKRLSSYKKTEGIVNAVPKRKKETS
jgi:hypothetical protein